MAPTGEQVFSTGQTWADILGLYRLMTLLDERPHSGNSTGVGLSLPVLMNPHYVPPNKGPMEFVLFLVPTIAACLFMVIRLSVRWNFKIGPRYAGNIFSEDWALLTGFVLTVIGGTLMATGTQIWQFGMAPYDMKISSLQNGIRASYAYLIIYIFAIGFIRLSLILFIKRLYSRISKHMRSFCDGMLVFTILLALSSAAAFAFQCTPFHASFDIFEKVRAHCLGPKLYNAVAALNIVADFAVAFLPMNLVWRMVALPTKKRIEVVIMFSLGLLACCASIVRFAFLSHTVITSNASYKGGGKSMDTAICCQMELCVAVITACIPQVKIFINRFTSNPSTMNQSRNTRNTSTHNNNNTANSRHNNHSRSHKGEETLVSRNFGKELSNSPSPTGTTVTVTTTRASNEFWTEQSLEQGKMTKVEFRESLPAAPMAGMGIVAVGMTAAGVGATGTARGRTKSEEVEEIYAKLPTALPKSVPPWMDPEELRTKNILLDDLKPLSSSSPPKKGQGLLTPLSPVLR